MAVTGAGVCVEGEGGRSTSIGSGERAGEGGTLGVGEARTALRALPFPLHTVHPAAPPAAASSTTIAVPSQRRARARGGGRATVLVESSSGGAAVGDGTARTAVPSGAGSSPGVAPSGQSRRISARRSRSS
jgi:hypothetical protein